MPDFLEFSCRMIRYLFLSFSLFSFFPLYSQTKQDLLTLTDRFLRFPSGEISAELITKKKFVSFEKRNLKIISKGQAKRILFSRTAESPENVYISDGRESVHFASLHPYHSRKISREEIIDRVLFTDFSFFDLSGFLFEKEFKPDRIEDYEVGALKFQKLTCFPVAMPQISKISLIFKMPERDLYRIDYFSRSGILMKSVKFRMGRVLFRRNGNKKEEEILKSIEITNADTNLETVLEFKSVVSDTEESADFTLENIRP